MRRRDLLIGGLMAVGGSPLLAQSMSEVPREPIACAPCASSPFPAEQFSPALITIMSFAAFSFKKRFRT